MGPQAMEGDLKVAPGTSLLVGYDFTIPGNHPEATVSFLDGSVTFQATCESGSAQGTIVVPLAAASYTDPQDSSAWYPSGDQHSASVYQGSTSIPDLCDGGIVRLKQGGTLTATIASTDPSHKVNVRWHYSANGSSGSWSGTRGCSCPPQTAASNRLARADLRRSPETGQKLPAGRQSESPMQPAWMR